MPLTRNQENVIIGALPGPVGRQLIAMMNQAGAAGANANENAGPVLPPLINNSTPVYTAAADYVETIGGVATIHLDIALVKAFWEVTMSLQPKHVHALCGEGITHPINLALFTSKEFDSIIRNMKSKVALPGIA